MISQSPFALASIASPEELSELVILLFEDNAADAELAKEYLSHYREIKQVDHVVRLADGLEQLGKRAYDVILLDLSLPDSRGIQSLEKVARDAGTKPIVILTGSEDEAMANEALQSGAQDYLLKDTLTAESLARSILYAISRAHLIGRVDEHARAIKQSETLFRSIFEMNTDSMLILGAGGQMRLVNRAAEELLDAAAGELVGQTFPFIVNSGEQTELEIPGPDGVRIAEVNAADMVWNRENAKLIVLRDVTKRKRAEMRLAAEKERLDITLNSIADAVFAVDSNGLIELINEAACKLTGWSVDQATGLALSDVLQLKLPEAERPLKRPFEALKGGDAELLAACEHGISLIARNGMERFVSVRMNCLRDDEDAPVGCVVVLSDITRKKHVDEEMFRAEKLHSISLLAGGIAHDFNNILTAVLGNISVVRMTMDANDDRVKKLTAAEDAALQAKGLTQQLLTFSKGGAPVLETATIDRLVVDSTEFILRGSNVKPEFTVDDGLWAVEIDKGQLSQVINNLVINADQAMPDGGKVQVGIGNVHLAPGEVPPLLEGDYICISIADQGSGIPKKYLQRIFDPYFTTKETGNGLGLASCYSIIDKHGGAIAVRSDPGEGACFSVYLPKAAGVPVKNPLQEAEADMVFHGSGRILVMDDMEAMMTVAGEMLMALGYDVEFTRDGEEAIEAYRAAKESGKPFDAAVFDLTVPGGMGGEEACRILREYDPEIIAIASSGYTTSPVMSDFRAVGFSAVVPKPYRIKEMSQALNSLLKRS